MEHFAGLDVSVKETSVCIVDDTGKIVREVKVASEPEALLAVLTNPAYHFKRIGLAPTLRLRVWPIRAAASSGRKRHASDGRSDSARDNRCWPRGHSCDVAIGNTDSERLRLARLNPTRYRGH